MSLFGNKNKVEEESIIEEKTEVVKPVNTVKPASVTRIADGVEMIGDFVTSDPIELAGSIKGNIVSETSLHVCENGKLKGDARVADLNVDGNINGTVVVRGLTSLSDTAEMKGSLQTAKFSSTPGSIFEGTFSMSLSRKSVQDKEPDKVEENTEE